MKKLKKEMLENRIKLVKESLNNLDDQYNEVFDAVDSGLVVSGPTYKTLLTAHINNRDALEAELDILEVHLRYTCREVDYKVKCLLESAYMRFRNRCETLAHEISNGVYTSSMILERNKLEHQLLELSKVVDVPELIKTKTSDGMKINQGVINEGPCSARSIMLKALLNQMGIDCKIVPIELAKEFDGDILSKTPIRFNETKDVDEHQMTISDMNSGDELSSEETLNMITGDMRECLKSTKHLLPDIQKSILGLNMMELKEVINNDPAMESLVKEIITNIIKK